MHQFSSWKTPTSFLVCVFCVAGRMASPAQTFQTLANFNGANGYAPQTEMYLVQGLDGNLYGTTVGGGQYGQGIVFKITSTGNLTPLYSFCSKSDCADGYQPNAGLIQGTDGNFYGTTTFGGVSSSACSDVSPPGCGTVFKITPAGKLTTLHRFHLTTAATPTEG
ncbi:MAG TPA: choice-of-anchor tandem repeat GloVer-containing protein [Terriglobales bacterium]|nr:choice-of-anchor tandem repeat GloVer-containing protein [Terriglobales bacterium]